MTPEEAVVGLRVRVIGAPERQGRIATPPREIDGGWCARVDFDDGARRNTRLDHFEKLPEHLDAISEIEAGRFHGPESLRWNLLHEKLHGRLSEVMYSMDTSDTNFLAYQFKPILKLLESPTNSLLIADEVGLGKTIEAGLIWTELKAREGANTLLVVCPPHLVTKWRNELKRRFGVEAQAAGPAEVLEKLNEARRDQSSGFALVATYHGLRPPKDWEDGSNGAAAQLARQLNEWGDTEADPFLDFLVMDEAAIMRNEGSQTSKLGGLLTPIAKHKVYLSATPLHTRARNLFTLLRRLDPDTFPDEQTFENILKSNAPLVALRDTILLGRPTRENLLAQLDLAIQSPLLAGNRTLADLRARISEEPNLTSPKVRAELAHQSEHANLLSYVVTRTRRRDVDTNPVLREVNTVKVPLRPIEQKLYQRVTETVHAYAESQDISAGFLTVMPQRQVASCMVAAYNRFNVVTDGDETINPDLTWDRRSIPAGPLIQFLRGEIAGSFDVQALRSCDSKYEKLREVIRHHWAEHPGSKIVLFAYFKPTLYYLNERLREDGIASMLLTGDETRDKQEVIDEFSRSDSAPILLSSEVGSEGLDLQFASVMVNYDLPWNPMVVEQRIGRIHRIGQKAARIIVINLICEDTVDERIYDRLYDRLDLFRRTLGDLEAVIGPLINDLTKDLFFLRLNAQQQADRIERTAVAMENEMKLQEKLEQDASVLVAYGDYVINQITAAHQRGDWINGRDIEAYVLSFFRRVFPATRVQGIDQSECIFEIELDFEAGHQFDEFLSLKKLRGQTRINTQARQRVRFDHRIFKTSGSRVEVVHQAHPLVRFIGYHLRVNRLVQPVAVAAEIPLELRPPNANPGLYAFVSQRWTVDGLRCHERLHHEVFSLGSQTTIEDSAIASSIVEIAGALGQECADAPHRGDEVLTVLKKSLEDLEFDSDTAFHRFLSRTKHENDDRKKIQLHGVQQFEIRRTTDIERVRDLHSVQGRKALVAAQQGKLESLRNKCEAQRQKVERKQTSGGCSTIAVGFILIH